MAKDVPHPLNVAGPFYVIDGCCTTCMVSRQEAPALMGFDEEAGHCFVKQQPATEEEVFRAIRAVWASDLKCLRYRGRDAEILRRLAEIGEEDACEHPPPGDAAPVLRSHVSFRAASGETPWMLAEALRESLRTWSPGDSQRRVTALVPDGCEVGFSFAWVQDHHHPLRVGPGEPGTGRWLIRHSPVERPGSVGLTLLVHDWLNANPSCSVLRWYSADQWEMQSQDWQPLPY